MNPSVSAAIADAFAVPIEGWDFSWLRNRAHETAPPWEFAALVRAAMRESRLALDVDTGEESSSNVWGRRTDPSSRRRVIRPT
jgi:hypothetical protein